MNWKTIAPWAPLLAVVLLLTLSNSGCSSCESEPEAREREPLSLIPQDHWIVGTVDMGPLRASSAYKRVIKRNNPSAYYLGNECEYDPLPSIDKLWIGAGDGVEKGRAALIAFGSIDRDKVLGCFREDLRRRGLSLEEVEIQGNTVYNAGPGRPHIAWLDAETVVIADRGNMEKVIALDKGQGNSVRDNQLLYKLWERAADGRDVAVAIQPTEKIAKQIGGLVPKNYSAIEGTKQIAFGLRFMKGMDLYLSLRLQEGDDAARVAGRAERDIKRAQENEFVTISGLSSHLRAINIEFAGSEITASAHLNDRQLDSLTRLAVDSIDEIMRESDPEKALRDRFRNASKNDAGPAQSGDADVDGATTGDAAQ